MQFPDREEILGVPVDVGTMDAVLERITTAAEQHRHFQVATVNLDFLVTSQQDAEVRSILRSTAINIPDGAPVVWAARRLGRPDASRIAGADLVPLLAERAAERGLRLFLLGGESGSATIAADTLTERYPSLSVSHFEPPRASLDDMDDATILDRVGRASPHILLVAFGHPKQEKWIHRNRASLPMVAVGVGCSLDLIAGRVSRAPRWMQDAGLEWSYRLAHEPRRLARRYAGDGLSVFRDLVPWVMTQRLSRV